jgi:hypothetical protein
MFVTAKIIHWLVVSEFRFVQPAVSDVVFNPNPANSYKVTKKACKIEAILED